MTSFKMIRQVIWCCFDNSIWCLFFYIKDKQKNQNRPRQIDEFSIKKKLGFKFEIFNISKKRTYTV